MNAASAFTRLVRFVPKSNPSRILIGQPEKDDLDIGIAVRKGWDVVVDVFSGSSILAPGEQTGVKEIINRILSPLAQNEAGTIRCIGLNYKQHATEVNRVLPSIPTVFLKPSNSLGDPWPAPTILPKLTQLDNSGDYESELAIIIGRTAKDVTEAEALDYILGYTAANDVSSRTLQRSESQWCFSKGFDGSCPLGPALVSSRVISDPSKLYIRGIKNGTVLQDCGIDDLIFNVPKLVSYLSQSTTLPAGTLIITGTPGGVGFVRKPKETIQDGDEFAVEILPHIGTLVNVFRNEQ